MKLDLDGKSFAGRPVLGALRLEVARGQRVAILGPSGIGKSTLLRILAGLDRDFRGRLDSRERLAVVFQEPTLLPWRRAVANITLPTGCDDAQARAFAARPGILLMDEPFASLDPDTAGRMMDLTARLLDRSGAGLILVTHDAAEAARLGAAPMRLAGSPAVLMSDQGLVTPPGAGPGHPQESRPRTPPRA